MESRVDDAFVDAEIKRDGSSGPWSADDAPFTEVTEVSRVKVVEGEVELYE